MSNPNLPASATGAPPTDSAHDSRQDAATQFAASAGEYLGDDPREIGRRVNDEQLELFVTGSPAEALVQLFEKLKPGFIALHDVGATVSLRLLAALAASGGRKLQRLLVRREGYGVPLATLQFAELPLSQQRVLRVYATAVDSDSQSREQLALALLAHSRLGVLLVGDVPAHVLDGALQPLRAVMSAQRWPNRELLAVPVGHVPTLAVQAASLTRLCGTQVRVTPQVSRATEAWAYVGGAWNRLHEVAPGAGARTSASDFAATREMPLDAMPGESHYRGDTTHEPTRDPLVRGVMQAQAQAQAQGQALHGLVTQLSLVRGVVSCCVFEMRTHRSLAHAGGPPSSLPLAAQGAAMLRTMAETSLVLGLGTEQPEAVVTLGDKQLLLLTLPNQPGLALHAVLERGEVQLTVLRGTLSRLLSAPLG